MEEDLQLIARFFGGVKGVMLGYACTLLQLHLGMGLVTGSITWAVGSNERVRAQLAGVEWQAVLKAWASAARPAALLVAFALIQVRAEAIGIISIVGLFLAGISTFLGTYLIVFVSICGGEVPDVKEGSGALLSKLFVPGLAKILNIIRAIGLLLLLAATLPEGTQLIIASGIIRSAIAAEVFSVLASAVGLEESLFAEVAADSASAMDIAPLVAALAVLDELSWAETSLLALPLQPMLYVAGGLASQVALIIVLHFGCGGGLKGGCAACTMVGVINRLARVGICLGLVLSIFRIMATTFECHLTMTGINIQWGELAIATALALCNLSLLGQIAQIAESDSPDQSQAVNVANGTDDHSEKEHAESTIRSDEHQALAGVSEPVKIITSRATGMILGLVALQMGAAETSGNSARAFFSAAFSGTWKIGFPLCALAMVLQLFLLVAFSISHIDEVPARDAVLDGTGTVEWEVQGKTGRKLFESCRSTAILLSQGGLSLGVLSLGVLPWIIVSLILLFVVFPMLPKQGKANAMNGLGWFFFFLRGCLGSLGAKVEAYLDEKRKKAEDEEARAARMAAEALAGEEADQERKAKNDDDFRFSPQKKKAAGGPKQKAKKK